MADYLSSFLGPVSVGTSPDKNPLLPFFGPPEHPIRFDPYDRLPSYQHALPKAYEGRSIFLGETMEQRMYNTPDFWTTILPMYQTEENRVEWSVVEYAPGFADDRPEETASRVLSSTQRAESRAFSRKGLALQMEHGFFLTEAGIRDYMRKVVQIIYSIINTMAYDTYRELLSCAERQIAYNREFGYFNAREITDVMAREKFRWAIVQKEPFGMEKIQAEIDEEMGRYGGKANTWILYPRLLTFLNLARDEKTLYNLAGPAGPQAVSKFRSNIPVATVANSRVYLAERIGEHALGTDNMMIRERSIGSYMLMDSKHLNDSVAYRSQHRSIMVYNEDTDGYSILTLEDAINHCQLFDANGKLFTPKGGRDMVNYSENLKRDFLRFPSSTSGGSYGGSSGSGNSSDWHDVQIFGQIRQQFINRNIIRRTAGSLAAGVYAVAGGQEAVDKALRDGINEIKRERTATLNEDSIFRLFGAGTRNAGADNVLEVVSGPQGSQLRPPERVWRADVFLNQSIGRIGWATIKDETDGVIGNFVTVVKAIVDHAARVLPQSLGIDERYAGTSTAIDAAYSTFMDNLIGASGFTVWMKPSIRGDGEAAEDTLAETFNAALDALRAAAADANAVATLTAIFTDLASDSARGRPLTQAFRAVLAGLLPHLDVQGDLAKFAAAVGKVNNSDLGSIIGFITSLKKAKIFATKNMTPILNGMEKTVSEANAPSVQAAYAGAPASSGDVFYRTPLRFTSTQVLQLQRAREAGAAWALKVTVSAPGTLDSVPADTTILKGLATRIERAMGGDRSYADDLLEVYPNLNINKFEQTRLSRAMKAPLRSQKRSRNELDGGRSVRYRAAYGSDTGDAMDVFDDEDVDMGGMGGNNRNVVTMPDLEPMDNLAAQVAGYYVSNDFLQHWANVDAFLGRDCERIMARLWLLTPVTKQALLTMVANDIDISVFTFIVKRPHARYNSSLGIYMFAGGETGYNFMGHVDVMLSNNATLKTHLGHITFYHSAVVHNPKNVYVAYDIFIVGCLGGAGIKPYVLGEYNASAGVYGQGSLFYVAIPGTETAVPNPMDLTGSWSKFDLPGSMNSDLLNQVHYSTFARYTAIWGWGVQVANHAIKTVTPLYHHDMKLEESLGWTVNTVVWKALTYYYNPISGNFDIKEANTNHWGIVEYAGCKAVRSGSTAHFDQSPPSREK